MIIINLVSIKRLRRNETYVYYIKEIIIKKYKNLIVIVILNDNCMMLYLDKDAYNNNNFT